jgi:hypothetical protein
LRGIVAGKGKAAATPSPAGPPEAAQTIEQSSDTLPVILSSNRRADISNFKGSTFVNIREYYEVSLLPASDVCHAEAPQLLPLIMRLDHEDNHKIS